MYFIFKVSILFFIHFYINAQVSGYVIDKKSTEGIEGVNIIFGNKGSFSDINGKFYIEAPLGSELKFSHIAYKNRVLAAEQGMLVEMEISYLQQEEIIIRSGISDESLESLHSSVSVFTSNDIRYSGFEHFQNLTDQISNLNWAGGTSRPRYFQIRGLGENSHYFGEGPPNFSVGFVFDNMDLSGLGMSGFSHDIKQIEVFKGAQSTIFGANSIGGLISINSNNPSEKFEGNIDLTGGTDGLYNIGGVLNFSLFRNFGIRLISFKNYSNGFRENVFLNSKTTNQKDEIANRIKFHYKPLDNLTFLGTYIYINQKNGYDTWAPDNNEKFITYSDDKGMDSQLTKGISLKTTLYLLENLKIIAISSLTNIKLKHSYDGDWADSSYWYENYGFNPQVEGYQWKFFEKNNRHRKTYTQELRTSIGSLVLGTYIKILKEIDEAAGYIYGGLATDAESQYDINSIAAYIQKEFYFTKKVKSKINLRYENNNIFYSGESSNEFEDYYGYAPIPLVKERMRSSMLGYSTVISYSRKFINYYASLSRGYKAGGINQEPNLSKLNRSYNPEYITNLELGIKTTNNNFENQFNLFFGKRIDQQVSISQQDSNDPNSFLFYTANAAKGIVSGLELENKYSGNKFEIGTNLGYLRTWIDEFEYEITPGLNQEAGNREFAMSPKLSGSIYFLRYLKNNIYVNVINTYKSKYYFSDSHDFESSDYFLTNISIGYSIKDIELKFWTRNIFNEVYETRGFYFTLTPNGDDKLYRSFGDPRQSGISLNYRF